MERIFLLFLGAAIFLGPSAYAEPPVEDYFCPEAEANLDAGDDYDIIEELPLVLMAGFVHTNRTNEGVEIGESQGCLLGTVDIEGGDTLVIFKFLDTSGEFPSRYQFVLMSETETSHMIALNTFSDIDAVAHELEMVSADARIYHLDEIGEDFVATYAIFTGEPSVNDLVGYTMSILANEVDAAITVEFEGEESTMIIREDLLEQEETEE